MSIATTAVRPAPNAETMLTRRVAPELLSAAADKPVDAIVFYKPVDGVHTNAAMNALQRAEAMPLGAERKALVYGSLQEIGNATLDANRPALEQLQKSGAISGIDELWSMNAVRVRGASLDAIKQLAGPNVKRIIADSIVAGPMLPAAMEDGVTGAGMVPMGKFEPSAKKPAGNEDPNQVWIDWGTKKMDAPAAWAQGITGAGITIASLDTGVIPSHSGLKANYRGTNPDGTMTHDYNLWNGVEKKAKEPIDDVGHGTHTIGSAVGNDAKHLVGVAPDAKFIIGRGLGEKGGSLFALMAGMQWMLAPTDQNGKNPRPDLAPDIVTNSWGGPPQSNPFLWMGLRNWRRAGIIPVFASGNSRNPQPAQVAAPGLHKETITVGASERNDQRAYFSMYGPSEFSEDKKPEIVAPGTWTYSTLPDGTFNDVFIVNGKEHPASGTSMATPHVAGAVALYMQANPGAKYDEILDALKRAGTEYATPSEDRGYGRLQVDKLITPESIAKNATLTDPARVKQLMDQVAVAKSYGPDRPPMKPAVKAKAAAN